MFLFIRRWLPTVQFLALIAGSIFAYTEYLHAIEQESKSAHGRQVAENLRFVEIFNRAHFVETRIKLGKAWSTEAFVELEKKWLTASEGTSRKEKFSQVTSQHVEAAAIQDEAIILFGFFKAVETCVWNAICDRETADKFFGEEKRKFWFLHKSFLIKNGKSLREDARTGFSTQTT